MSSAKKKCGGPEPWGSPQRKTLIIIDQLQVWRAVSEPALPSYPGVPTQGPGERPPPLPPLSPQDFSTPNSLLQSPRTPLHPHWQLSCSLRWETVKHCGKMKLQIPRLPLTCSLMQGKWLLPVGPCFLTCKTGRRQHCAVGKSTDVGARRLGLGSEVCHSSCATHVSGLQTRDNPSV